MVHTHGPERKDIGIPFMPTYVRYSYMDPLGSTDCKNQDAVREGVIADSVAVHKL